MKTLQRVLTSLSVIIMVAIVIRAGFVFYETLGRALPEHFAWENGRIGRSLAMGKGFGNPYPNAETGPTAIMAPLYPLLLGGIFKLFGVFTYTSYYVVTMFNELVSALTCIPIFYLGKRFGGIAVGATAAWMWVFFPTAIVVPVQWIWDTSLMALVLTCILWATQEISESVRVRNWIGYGLVWGFAIALNPSVLSLLPFLFGWLAWKKWRNGFRWMRLPIIALLIMSACCVPWTVRNYIAFHKFIPFRSNFGLELWLGNNPDNQTILADGGSPFLNPALRKEYVQLGEVAFMKVKGTEALHYIAANPGTFVKFSWYRFAETWLGVTEPFVDAWSTNSWDVRIPLAINVFVILMGLAGLFILHRSNPRIGTLVAIFPFIYPAVYYITHPALRYRHPIDPILLVLAAFALSRMVRRTSRQPDAPVAVLIACAL